MNSGSEASAVDLQRAREALASARQSGDKEEIQRAAYSLGLALQQLGDLDSASQVYDEALSVENEDLALAALFNKSLVEQQLGHPELAARGFEEISQRAPSADMRVRALLSLGLLKQSIGDLESARGLLEEVTDTREAFQARDSLIASAAYNLGAIYSDFGEFIRARIAYELALWMSPNKELRDAAGHNLRALIATREASLGDDLRAHLLALAHDIVRDQLLGANISELLSEPAVSGTVSVLYGPFDFELLSLDPSPADEEPTVRLRFLTDFGIRTSEEAESDTGDEPSLRLNVLFIADIPTMSERQPSVTLVDVLVRPDAESVSPQSGPLTPQYEFGDPWSGIQLWEGSARLQTQKSPRPTTIELRFQPRMDVFFRQDTSNTLEDLQTLLGGSHDERLIAEEIDLATACIVTSYTPPQGLINRVTLGQFEDVKRVQFHVLNFPTVLLPEALEEKTVDARRLWRGRLRFHTNKWRVQLDATSSASAAWRNLRDTGGYALTHVGSYSRVDREPMSMEESDELLSGLGLLLSFCRGAWSAPLLPVGFDSSGKVVWREWAARHVTAGRSSLTWLDDFHPEAFGAVAEGFLARWEIKYWRDVLQKLIPLYLEGNRQGTDSPTFLETRTLAAFTGLELLATALVGEQMPDNISVVTPIKERFERLIQWSRLPSQIPEELGTLIESKAFRVGSAEAIINLRNSLVYGSIGSFQELTSQQKIEAWQLVVWYLELSLLRLFGFRGEYASRLRLEKWKGETERVPWS